jgi:hypothetical protein
MLPELSFTSWLTLAVKRALAAGLDGIEVSVLTLISVPWGRFCCALAPDAVAAQAEWQKTWSVSHGSLWFSSAKDAAAQRSCSHRARIATGEERLDNELAFSLVLNTRKQSNQPEYFLPAPLDTWSCPTGIGSVSCEDGGNLLVNRRDVWGGELSAELTQWCCLRPPAAMLISLPT